MAKPALCKGQTRKKETLLLSTYCEISLSFQKRLRQFTLIGITVLLVAIYLSIPDFYSSLWALALSGDVRGTVNFLASFGTAAMLVSFGILVAFNAVGFLPNFFLLAANGMFFGIINGTLISWLGECVGAVIGFYLMRGSIRNYALCAIERAGYLEKVNEFSGRKSFQAVLLTRALPYVPSGLVTAAAAVSFIGIGDYFLATVMGKLPSCLIEVMIGHDLIDFNKHTGRLAALAALIIGVYAYIWWSKRKKENSRS